MDKTPIHNKTWLPWNSNGKHLLYKMAVENGNGFHVMWTDMNSLWSEKLTGEEIVQRTQELNPDLEAPIETILQHIMSQTNADTCTVTERGDDGGLAVTMNSSLASISFVWKFVCKLSSQEELCKALTIPLMKMVTELQRRQQSFVAKLKKKDAEISDYKSQGVRTSRRNLETTPFDENTFMTSMTKGFDAVASCGERLTFDSNGQDLYSKIMEKEDELKNMAVNMNDETNIPNGDDPSVTPTLQSPARPSPQKKAQTPEKTPTKESELERREALAKRLASDEQRKEDKAKKKKKKALF